MISQQRCVGWTSANQSAARTLLFSIVDLILLLYTEEATHDLEKKFDPTKNGNFDIQTEK